MSKKLANYYSYTPEQFYKATRLDLCKQVTGCAGGGGGGLTQVTTTNSGTVIFNGNGTVDSPLTADVEVSGITTLYTGDSVITGNRVVTMPANQALTFNSTSPTQFAVTLQTAALVVSNTGGSTILLNTNSGTDYLNVGSAGTRLVSPLASVDLSFSGGIKILRGDDNGTNYSRFLMAPGTSTPPSWNDVSANGASGVVIQATSSNSTDGVSCSSTLLSNGYIISSRITPTRFYINKLINVSSTNVKLFEVNQDGSVYLPAILNAASLGTDATGKIIVGSGGSAGNPTASIGLSTINGAATTFMRSDAAPALDQSITPTWTGVHSWTIADVGGEAMRFGHNNATIGFYDPTFGTLNGFLKIRNLFGTIGTTLATPFSIFTNGTDRLIIDANGSWLINGDPGASDQVLSSRGSGQTPVWKTLPTINKGIAAFTADNTTTVFNIPHGLSTTPSWYEAFNLTGVAGNYAARTITVDATNIIITFANPPTTSDGNAQFAWKAEV